MDFVHVAVGREAYPKDVFQSLGELEFRIAVNP